MSTPSPLQSQSQGALAEASSPKSRVRITVLTILALHVVVIGGLLLQGCDKRPPRTAAATNTVSTLPPLTDATAVGGFPADAGASPPTGLPGGGTPGGLGAGLGGTPGGAGTLADSGAAARPLGGGTLGGGGLGTGGTGQPALGAGGSTPLAGAGGGLASLPPVSTLPPAGSPSTAQGTEHVIKPNDRIADLAKKYNVTEAAILEANPGAKPRSLKVGDKLMIPPPAPPAASTAGAGGTPSGTADGTGTGASAPAPASGEVYLVKQGDTLAKIAKKFGLTVKQLKAANNLKSDRIVPKQKLTIPAKSAAMTAPASTTAAARRSTAGGSI